MTEITPTETAATPEAHERKLAAEQKFINDLAELLRSDTGKAAVLRRNAGNSICEARGVAWFHSLLGRHSKSWNEEAYFLVATLFASDKEAVDGKNKSKGDFGATLRALRSKSAASPTDSSPLDRRFNILLDADYDPGIGGELAFRLRQTTKRIIAGKDRSVCIAWPQLLYDVKRWNHETKWIQKKWARSYYAPKLDSPDDNQPETAE